MADFIRIASTADVPPGEGRVVDIAGRTIALFNVAGQFYALDNTCAHRGGPLGEGYCDPLNLTVQCPWHGWIYSLQTGDSTIDSSARVQKFDVVVEGDEVKVMLD